VHGGLIRLTGGCDYAGRSDERVTKSLVVFGQDRTHLVQSPQVPRNGILRPAIGDRQVQAALRAAAAEDENGQVQCACHFALRLENGSMPRQAAPFTPVLFTSRQRRIPGYDTSPC
jgi:hypothetical protein